MNDLNGYIKRMEYSMHEKMFFVDKLDLNEYDLIVDFGCANGDLLRKLRAHRPVGVSWGFDISAEMIKIAKASNTDNQNFFTTDIGQIKSILGRYKKSLVIFSSVLHEIEQASDRRVALEVMSLVDTVVIRDMYFPHLPSYLQERIPAEVLTSIFSKTSPYMIYSFQMWHGNFEDVNRNFYHFLLKYTYVDNWETEVQEDYFSTPWEMYISELSKKGIYVSHDYIYTLPYKQTQVLKDFGYEMKLPTHRNLILRRGA